jgi:carbon-monoxide dehydrogenase small subunit
MEEHGLQCGFCTSGMMLTARALLDREPDPDEATIREAISGQICRCTGYATIVRSIRWAAEHPATDGAAAAPATAEEVSA